MMHFRDSYANILAQKRILYVPTCLIIEMMTRLYSQVAAINLTGNIHCIVPDLLVLLRRLTADYKMTVGAHQETRIRFFIGDWRDDKLRARKLFFNLLSRLGYISELLAAVEKKLIFQAIEEMTAEWTVLDRIMEERCLGTGACSGNCGARRQFRSRDLENWRGEMAATVLALHARTPCGEDEHLILLCYNKMKEQLLPAIEKSQQRARGDAARFRPDAIVAVSDEDVAFSCPTCTMMTDSLRRGTSDVIRRGYAAGAARPTRGFRDRADERRAVPAPSGDVSGSRERDPVPASLPGRF